MIVIVPITILGITIGVLICIFIVVVTVLTRAKYKIGQELMQSKANAVYDEIGIPQQIDSTKNVAYISSVAVQH